MEIHFKDLYKDAIKSCIHDVYDIRAPQVRGAQNSTLIADSATGTYVCKFNNYDLAMKNMLVANVFADAGIPVPNITICKHGDVYFEKYPIIQGKTLYERIGNGINRDKIQQIYRDIAMHFKKMSDIDITKIPSTNFSQIHRCAMANTRESSGLVAANIIAAMVYALNRPGANNTGLYHCGITPKNIVVAPDDTFGGFIDLDEIGICNKNYAFAMMAAKYGQIGMNINELCNYYQDISGQKLNRRMISTVATGTNGVKHILWRISKAKGK